MTVHVLLESKIKAGQSDPTIAFIKKNLDHVRAFNSSRGELEFIDDYVFDFPDLYLEFPTYRLVLREPIDVTCNPREHTGFKWVTAEECYAMPDLIRGLHDLLKWTGYIK